jgi:molybdopterin converting factor small subunit
MRITVELFGLPARRTQEDKGALAVNLEGGATVGRLIERLALPPDVRLMVLINGQRVDNDHSLSEGDEVFIFSPAEGG